MNTYRVKFETIMVATSPTMAAEKVHEGLEAGNYQRSIFNVTDVNTDEESEEIVSEGSGMITYSLYIHVDDEFEDPRSTLSTAAIDAANAIEMRHSEYFTWIDDEQESLSRSNAINLAEKDMQEYLHVKKHLWWFISNSADKSRQGQVKQEAAL